MFRLEKCGVNIDLIENQVIQTDKDKNVDDSKNSKNQIIRCPKCRSINPPNANYCNHCGKVFRAEND